MYDAATNVANRLTLKQACVGCLERAQQAGAGQGPAAAGAPRVGRAENFSKSQVLGACTSAVGAGKCCLLTPASH